MIKLPPRYIPLPSTIVYCRTVPSELKDFFGALYGMAWETKYAFTPEMPTGELLDLLKLKDRTYQYYVQALERLAWLRSETHRNGCVRFHFPERFQIPQEKITGCQLNDKNVALPQNLAFTQNLALSGDDEEDDLLTNPKNIRSSSSSSHKLDILKAAGVIDTQLIMDEPGITADDVLAELAYCYDPSNRIRKPDRITGNNLLSGHRPSAIYYADYERYIPASILERAGIIEPEATEPSHAEMVEEEPAAVEFPASVSGVGDPLPCGKTPDQVWDILQRQLQLEMPRSTFEHIRDACFLGYRAADSTVIVAAANSYSRDWLEGRMSSTIKRLLTGIINAHIEVQFVTQ
jgi:hypothetical protein